MGKYKIADFAEVVTGGTPSTSVSEYWNGDIPWLPSGACQDCEITSAETFITKAGLDNSAAKMMPEDTVLIALTGATTGKTGLLKFSACGNQSVTGILPNKSFIPKYLFNYLQYIRPQILSDSYGGAQKHISQGYVKNLLVELPSLEEQKKVAGVLDAATAFAAKRRRQLALLDTLTQSRFVEMFGDPITNTKNWSVYLLGDLFTVGSSKRVYQSEQVTDGVPFLRISDLMNRIENKGETADLFITETLYEKLKDENLVPAAGDILVTSRGTLGRCYEIRNDDRFYFQDGMISWLYDRSEKILNTYLIFLFQMAGFRVQIDEAPPGSTVNYLSIARLKNLKVMCPPISLQNEFAEFVSEVDRQKAALRRSLTALTTLKSALMQEYFGN